MSLISQQLPLQFAEEKEDDLEVILESCKYETTNQYTVKSVSKQSESVIEILEDIQRDNPQIETVFIDSDNDDDEPDIKPVVDELEVKTVVPPYRVIPCNPAKAVPRNPNSPFVVQRVSPSNIDPDFITNANTIALEDQTDNSARRFLVIPKEILPLLAKSNGPVSLHVPGIGALVIPKPSEIIIPVTKKTPKNTPIAPKKTPEPKPYDPLTDPKYNKYWIYRRNLKRDLEGLTMKDRLGFYSAEQTRAKMCALEVQQIVNDLREDLSKMDRIFPVKSTILKVRRPRKQTFPLVSKSLSQKQKQNLKTLMSWKEHFGSSRNNGSETESDIEGNNLLITKKVVVLRKGKKRGRKRKRKRLDSGGEDFENFERDQDPDFILGNKRRRLQPKKFEPEHPVKRGKVGRPRKIRESSESEDISHTSETIDKFKSKSSDNENKPSPVKRPVGRPRKIKRVNNSNNPEVKECYIDVPTVQVSPNTLTEAREYYKEKPNVFILESLEKMQEKMDPSKPMLVVNKLQCSSLNLTDLCTNNNIVYPVGKETELSIAFLESIRKFNVMFVRPDILGLYLVSRT